MAKVAKKGDDKASGPIKLPEINRDERKALDMKSGDTVKVYQRINEKGKIRLQIFEGLVLARKHGTENGATFTVRKVSQSVGVERVFPLYSPSIEKIEVTRRSKTRRSKLYFVREKAVKEMSKRMKTEMLDTRKVSQAKAVGKKVDETEEVEAEVVA